MDSVETAVLRVADALSSDFEVTVAHGGSSLPVTVGETRFASLDREVMAPTRSYDLVVSIAARHRSTWRVTPTETPWIAWMPAGIDVSTSDCLSFIDAGGVGFVSSHRAGLEKIEAILVDRADTNRPVRSEHIEDPIDDLLVPYPGLAIRDRVGVELSAPFDAVATWSGLERLRSALPGARIVVLARGDGLDHLTVPQGIEVIDVSREAAFVREARLTCVVVDLSPSTGKPSLTNRRLLAAIGVPVTRTSALASRWRECEDTTRLSSTLTVPETRPDSRLGLVKASWIQLLSSVRDVSPS